MRRLRKTFRLAQKMGQGLGKCPLLLRQVPQGALGKQSSFRYTCDESGLTNFGWNMRRYFLFF